MLFLKLIRWKNLLIIIITQCLVRYFLLGVPNKIGQDSLFFILVLSTVLIAAAGYIINDYFDVKIDLINKPKEVYIGRIIKRRYALILHQVLSGLGILISIFLGWKIFLLNIFAVTLLWFYASIFKKKPFFGNAIVAFLTALAIFELAILFNQNEKIIGVYAIFAFCVNLIREIIKDIEDIKGDEAHGAKTLPIVYGVRRTKDFLYAIFAILTILVVYFAYKINNQHLTIIFELLSLFGIYIIYKIVKADRKSQFQEISRLCKIFMILGIGSMLVL